MVEYVRLAGINGIVDVQDTPPIDPGGKESVNPEPPKQDPPKPEPPKQDPQKLEQDLVTKAKAVYDAATSKWDTQKGSFTDERLAQFLDAYASFRKAEDADPSSNKYGTYLDQDIPDWIAFIALKRMAAEGNPAKVNEWYARFSKYDGKDFFAQLKDASHTTELDAVLNKHQIKHDPYVKKQDPQPTPEPTITPQPVIQTQDPPQPQPTKSEDPFAVDRIRAALDIGSFKSSQDRSAGLDARVAGFEVIAQAERNKFNEAVSDDKIVEKGFGAAAAIDLNRLLGVPLKFGASFDEREHTRDGFDSSETDDALFNIKTFTDVLETETTRYLAAFARGDIGKMRLGGTLFDEKTDIDVDVSTRVELINKTDPAGNYTQIIPTNESFALNKRGFQFDLEYLESEQFRLGGLFTMEQFDLSDFGGRDISNYSLHVFGRHQSKDGKFGLGVMVGEALQDDEGTERDRFGPAEWNVVTGYELSDLFTVGGRFSYLTDPHAALFFALGKGDKKLHALLNHAWYENMVELDLDKSKSKRQQDVFLAGRDEDLKRAYAQQNQWMLLLQPGVKRVQEDDKDKWVFEGGATVFVPITDEWTLSFNPYRLQDDLMKRTGLIIGAHPKNSRWDFGIEVAKEETDGRSQEDEEFRGLFSARYSLGK